MTLPTHCVLGYIIGRATGQYSAAMVGSVFMDSDHLVSFVRHRVLWNPRRLFTTMMASTDPYDDQRGVFHSVPACLLCAVIVYAFFPASGIAFGLAYLGHLLFDALDGSGIMLFFPLSKMSVKGPITYGTWREGMLIGILVVIAGIQTVLTL